MKLGLIADVHANLPALEAVLADMPDRVDELVCLGDVVGYNPYPAECVDLVRRECDHVLQGNHDRELTNPKYGSHRQAVQGLQLARETLDAEDREYLLARPETAELAGGSLLAAHSHPVKTDAYVFPDEYVTVSGYLDEYDALLLGHTHLQASERFDGGVVVNPGSVGQPRDEATAAYAVLDTDSLNLEFYRTGYDIWKVIREINRTGLPEETGKRLLPGSVPRSGNRGSHRPGPW